MIRRAKNLHLLERDFHCKHAELNGITFENEWCNIEKGRLTVYSGYAWDGCSPKWEVAGLGVVGVPDGRLYEGKPITYYPSLVHDVFCQFRGEIRISKEAVVQIWNDMLAERQFGARLLYVTAVDWLGPQDFHRPNVRH